MEINKTALLDESLRCYNLCKRYNAEKNFPEFQYWKGKLTGIGIALFLLGYKDEGNICRLRAEEFTPTGNKFPSIGRT